ncbi:MAG: Smr/MutS family protein, partial [Nitrospinaceae bacterium]
TLTQQVQIREALQEQENQLRRNKAQRLQVYLRDAKREIRKLLAEAKTKSAAPDLRQVEKRLHAMHRAEGRVPSAKRAHYTIPADRLRRGDEVMIDGYESIGILEEDPQKKSKLRVRLGNFSTVVAAGRLFGHTRGLRTCQPETPSIQIQTETQRPPTSTCDLRGLNLEEARDAMEVFLSQAVLNKIPRATLIHGHGMGKIKQMVRDYLDATRLGKSFGPASRNEGGDGATIIEF